MESFYLYSKIFDYSYRFKNNKNLKCYTILKPLIINAFPGLINFSVNILFKIAAKNTIFNLLLMSSTNQESTC